VRQKPKGNSHGLDTWTGLTWAARLEVELEKDGRPRTMGQEPRLAAQAVKARPSGLVEESESVIVAMIRREA
jgi:hypothetical protein